MHSSNPVHSIASNQTHGDTPFSRASHFAWVLTPVILGLGYSMLVRDIEGSFGFRITIYGLFLFSIGSSIRLLSRIDKIE